MDPKSSAPNQTNVDFNDHLYRNRIRTLQAVDKIVEGVISRLLANSILENSYVIYTTDNGYHIGQHRLQPGKECSYEEDIYVPLIIRGLNVPGRMRTGIVTTHTDLAPTIFSIINKRLRDDFDGIAIPVTANGLQKAKAVRHEHVNVEYWGFAPGEGKYNQEIYWNNTYKALRVIDDVHCSVWCNNEHELHDLIVGRPSSLNLIHSRYRR